MKVCDRCKSEKPEFSMLLYRNLGDKAQDTDLCKECVAELWEWLGYTMSKKEIKKCLKELE